MKKTLFQAMIFVGFAGWFSWFLSFPSYIESPNSKPHGIALNSQGSIYCGVSGYGGRVQEYTSKGKFVRAYSTHGGTGRGSSFDFYVDANDFLCTRVFGYLPGHKGSYCRLSEYDRSGTLIRSERTTSPTADFYFDVANTAQDADGNTYTFKGFLFPRVVKHTHTGASEIVVRPAILTWPFQAPLPAFAFLAIPALLGLLKAAKTGGRMTDGEVRLRETDRDARLEEIVGILRKGIIVLAKAITAMAVAMVGTACVAVVFSSDRNSYVIGYALVPATVVYLAVEAVKDSSCWKHILYWVAVVGSIAVYTAVENPGVPLDVSLRCAYRENMVLAGGGTIIYLWLLMLSGVVVPLSWMRRPAVLKWFHKT